MCSLYDNVVSWSQAQSISPGTFVMPLGMKLIIFSEHIRNNLKENYIVVFPVVILLAFRVAYFISGSHTLYVYLYHTPYVYDVTRVSSIA